jgi:hypothetical protein
MVILTIFIKDWKLKYDIVVLAKEMIGSDMALFDKKKFYN